MGLNRRVIASYGKNEMIRTQTLDQSSPTEVMSILLLLHSLFEHTWVYANELTEWGLNLASE